MLTLYLRVTEVTNLDKYRAVEKFLVSLFSCWWVFQEKREREKI